MMLRHVPQRLRSRAMTQRAVKMQQRMFTHASVSVSRSEGVLRPALLTNPVQHTKSATAPATMTLAMDAMQHESRQQAQEQAQHLLYWQSALAASSLCIASSLSDDQTASCAGSSTSSSNDDDPLAKLQQFVRDSLNGMDIKLPAGMEDLQKEVNDFLASGKGGQISWGFMMGAFSGFTMKKLSKAGAVALGGVFILMQCASYAGYIDVNYQKLERDVMEFLDLNHDGKVDTQDANELFKSVMKVLEFSLPAGSGFAVGFLIGFRRG